MVLMPARRWRNSALALIWPPTPWPTPHSCPSRSYRSGARRARHHAARRRSHRPARLARGRRSAHCSSEAGLDEKQAKLRAKQLFHWIYHRGVTDFAAMTDIAKTMRPWLERALRHRPARGRRGAGFDRRHAQVAAAHRRRPRFRDGVHPRCGPRHVVRVEPGRLHAQLPLLPHRHDAAGAQPDPGRDRRPGHAGARCARRMAEGRDGRGR